MIRFSYIILALSLFMIPAKPFAKPTLIPWDLSVGGGSNMFAVGVDWGLSGLKGEDFPVIYRFAPGDVIIWTVRTRFIYDYDEHKPGFFLQPNLRFLYQLLIFDITVGPEIGWFIPSGFDYGASARLGITPFIYFEVGHFFNSKRTYFNISGNIPFLVIFGMFLSK